MGDVKSIYYNLANGYLYYYTLTSERFINLDNVIIKAKNNYNKALSIDNNDSELSALILINLGNIYSKTGRYIDALDSYDLALKMKPTHELAIINKGSSLIEYSSLCVDSFPFIHNAYLHYKEALKSNDLNPKNKTYLKKIIKSLEKKYGEDILNKNHDSNLKINNENTFQGFYTLFCLMNKLYLNTCNFCQKCNSSIGDMILIK